MGDYTTTNNVLITNKGKTFTNMLPNSKIQNSVSNAFEISGNFTNLLPNQAEPPSIAEMILHGISVSCVWVSTCFFYLSLIIFLKDSEIIHNWLRKIKMSKYEKNFIDAAYDMSTIARMTPQVFFTYL